MSPLICQVLLTPPRCLFLLHTAASLFAPLQLSGPCFPSSSRLHLHRFTLTSGALLSEAGSDRPPRLAPLGPACLRSALTRFATSECADLNWRGQNFLERNNCRLDFARSPERGKTHQSSQCLTGGAVCRLLGFKMRPVCGHLPSQHSHTRVCACMRTQRHACVQAWGHVAGGQGDKWLSVVVVQRADAQTAAHT